MTYMFNRLVAPAHTPGFNKRLRWQMLSIMQTRIGP
jgi:hypothetical protein